MQIFKLSPYLLILTLLFSCIQDDIIDDYVEPEIRITDEPDSLKEGTSYQYMATFYNNIGMEEEIQFYWESSNPLIFTVDNSGTVTGISKGSAELIVSANYQGMIVTSKTAVNISSETVIVSMGDRTGTLRTTSSYPLKGTFILKELENNVILEFLQDYETTSILPGLYIYLTNNPNTNNNAFEIGEVKIFSGAHSYNLGDSISLTQFKYVLYYCKPFSVKVGDGEIK